MIEDKGQSLMVVSLWVKNLPVSVHFYRDAIGLELLSHHGNHPALKIGDTHLVIIQGRDVIPKFPPEPRWPILALRVPDLDAAVQRLRAHNIELPWGIERSAQARYVMFHDPDGYLLEIAELIGAN